jgi:membrane-bound ClpP family serine protease
LNSLIPLRRRNFYGKTPFGALIRKDEDTAMILMPIIMLSPFLALVLFYYLPFQTALRIYIAIVIVAGYGYYIMFKSMRAKVKTGMEAMMGAEALVIEDIDPEGKVRFKDEIWTATTPGKKISQGEKVRILEAEGLVLVVERLDADGQKIGSQ